MNLLSKLDASLAVTRPLWRWLGQVALVVLGTHLGADRLDDAAGAALSDLPVAWPDPQTPFTVGLGCALVLEVLVTIWAVRALARTCDRPVGSARAWARRWSVHNLVGPLFWLPVSLAGCWSIAMAVEDLLPVGEAARWIGCALGVLVAWRLAGTGLMQLVLAPPQPRRRREGLAWVLPLGLVGWFAARDGLPIWGWI